MSKTFLQFLKSFAPIISVCALFACTASYNNELLNSVLQEENPRQITTVDLISLADIGPRNAGFSVSPDQSLIAIQVHRPNISENAYHIEWIAVPLAQPESKYSLGDGGDVILSGEYNGRINGVRVYETAKWSPNSEWIAYRAKHNGEVQLWRSSRDGKRQQQITRAPGDVLTFAWSNDGTKLYYQVGRDRSETANKLTSEGERGFLFNERFWPLESSRPVSYEEHLSYPFKPAKPELWVYDFQKSNERMANEVEALEFQSMSTAAPQSAELPSRDVRHIVTSTSEAKTVVWAENANPANKPGYYAPLTVFAQTEKLGETRCRATECTGRIFKLLWNEKRKEAFFFVAKEPVTTRLESIPGSQERIW